MPADKKHTKDFEDIAVCTNCGSSLKDDNYCPTCERFVPAYVYTAYDQYSDYGDMQENPNSFRKLWE